MLSKFDDHSLYCKGVIRLFQIHVTLTHRRHQLLLEQLLYMYLLSKSGDRRSYECRDLNFYHCFHCFVITFSQIFKSEMLLTCSSIQRML